jgi:hypothetical protein
VIGLSLGINYEKIQDVHVVLATVRNGILGERLCQEQEAVLLFWNSFSCRRHGGLVNFYIRHVEVEIIICFPPIAFCLFTRDADFVNYI